MKQIACPPGRQIADFLREAGEPVRTLCGSRGNCGKCLIRVVRGNLPASGMDQVQLTKEQLQQGIRLACQAYPKETVVVERV
ncbi:MAG: 2Fe-2S iron-sulfur cluster binding domain-containing protein [Blautia sp.]|nr:2Fe-2S iron-sulfur cluster binding domain-containing protein [Blautia sp.]